MDLSMAMQISNVILLSTATGITFLRNFLMYTELFFSLGFLNGESKHNTL